MSVPLPLISITSTQDASGTERRAVTTAVGQPHIDLGRNVTRPDPRVGCSVGASMLISHAATMGQP